MWLLIVLFEKLVIAYIPRTMFHNREAWCNRGQDNTNRDAETKQDNREIMEEMIWREVA